MKFLAILRDSVREAFDSKVIYFLLGLSALVVAVLAGVSFRAKPAEEGLRAILERIPGVRAAFGQPAAISASMAHFEQVNPGRPVWEGEYRYDLTFKENDLTPKAGKGPRKGIARPGAAPGQPGAFRAIVLLTTLWGTPDDELSEADLRLKKRMGKTMLEMMRSGGQPNARQTAEAEEFAREVDAVGPARMEAWVRRQLAASGALEATAVRFEEEGGGTFRFRVECRAGPDTVWTWPHDLVLFFGALPLSVDVGVGTAVYFIEDFLVAGLGAGLAMLLSTIVTAFFIPNMLRKGTIDLLLAKPVGRPYLLLSKYVGGLTFMFVNTVVIVAGIWLVLGLRSGLWGAGFLLSISVLTLQFAIFYAFSVLLGVLTRSAIVSILGACALWFLLWGAGLVAGILRPLHESGVAPAWAAKSADAVRAGLPRYKDLDRLSAALIARDLLAAEGPQRREAERAVRDVDWGTSLAVTAGWIGLFLGLACWRFAVKDY